MKRVNGVDAMVKREECGQGLAEYGLIVVLISITAMVLMGTIGDQVKALFDVMAGVLP